MGWVEAALIVGAAALAGALNVLVGGGSLITYPTLMALGYPPVLANVSNNLGLIPGNAAGVLAYRPLLAGHRGQLLALVPASLLGGLSGAILLLALPANAHNHPPAANLGGAHNIMPGRVNDDVSYQSWSSLGLGP